MACPELAAKLARRLAASGDQEEPAPHPSAPPPPPPVIPQKVVQNPYVAVDNSVSIDDLILNTLEKNQAQNSDNKGQNSQIVRPAASPATNKGGMEFVSKLREAIVMRSNRRHACKKGIYLLNKCDNIAILGFKMDIIATTHLNEKEELHSPAPKTSIRDLLERESSTSVPTQTTNKCPTVSVTKGNASQQKKMFTVEEDGSELERKLAAQRAKKVQMEVEEKSNTSNTSAEPVLTAPRDSTPSFEELEAQCDRIAAVKIDPLCRAPRDSTPSFEALEAECDRLDTINAPIAARRKTSLEELEEKCLREADEALQRCISAVPVHDTPPTTENSVTSPITLKPDSTASETNLETSLDAAILSLLPSAPSEDSNASKQLEVTTPSDEVGLSPPSEPAAPSSESRLSSLPELSAPSLANTNSNSTNLPPPWSSPPPLPSLLQNISDVPTNIGVAGVPAPPQLPPKGLAKIAPEEKAPATSPGRDVSDPCPLPPSSPIPPTPPSFRDPLQSLTVPPPPCIPPPAIPTEDTEKELKPALPPPPPPPAPSNEEDSILPNNDAPAPSFQAPSNPIATSTAVTTLSNASTAPSTLTTAPATPATAPPTPATAPATPAAAPPTPATAPATPATAPLVPATAPPTLATALPTPTSVPPTPATAPPTPATAPPTQSSDSKSLSPAPPPKPQDAQIRPVVVPTPALMQMILSECPPSLKSPPPVPPPKPMSGQNTPSGSRPQSPTRPHTPLTSPKNINNNNNNCNNNNDSKPCSPAPSDELSSLLERRVKIIEGEAVPDRVSRQLSLYAEFSEFSRKQIKFFTETFKKYDEDRDGFIDFDELKLMMEKLGEAQTHLALKDIIKQVDEDKDGKICLREFLLIFRKAAQGTLGCSEVFTVMAESVDVTQTGVLGAASFFQAKIEEQGKLSKFEEEIKEEQEIRRKEEEEKKERREKFLQSKSLFH